MVKSVAVFGSCVSRDLFFSKFNPNYKDFFNIKLSSQRSSLISIMQKPFSVDDNEILITPENNANIARMNFLRDDFEKTFIKGLVKSPVDYVVLDNYFEVRMGVLILKNGDIITNNNWDLPATSLYKKLDIDKKLSIQEDTNEFYKLWKENCDIFFEFLEDNCNNTKIVLNSFKQVFKVLKRNSSTYINNDFKKQAKSTNKFLKKLDDYIIKNHDIDVLYFDENTLADENHLWGLGPVHYEMKYYKNKLNQLITICKDGRMANKDLTLLNNEILRYKKDITSLKNQLTLEKENASKTKEYLLILENNKNFFNSQKEENNRLKSEINNIQGVNDDLVKKVNELKEYVKLFNSQKEENDNLKNNIHKFKKENEKLLIENERLITKNRKLNGEKLFFQNQEVNLKKENRELNRKLKEYSSSDLKLFSLNKLKNLK